MKKTLSTVLLATTLFSLQASAYRIKREAGPAISAAGSSVGTILGVSTGAGFLAGAGAAAVTVTFASVIFDANNYEGLDQESVEVLAGQAELEDQPALSLFKEDVLMAGAEIEEHVFAQTGESIDLQSLSDEDFAILGLQVSKK